MATDSKIVSMPGPGESLRAEQREFLDAVVVPALLKSISRKLILRARLRFLLKLLSPLLHTPKQLLVAAGGNYEHLVALRNLQSLFKRPPISRFNHRSKSKM